MRQKVPILALGRAWGRANSRRAKSPHEVAVPWRASRPSRRLALARLQARHALFSWFCSSFVHFDAKTFWTGQIT
ncbi:hypothetical protein Q3G72_027196 [Acer saccharum]|nr:hypothetical protein Q3G72_027196 [Acer saccharum]